MRWGGPRRLKPEYNYNVGSWIDVREGGAGGGAKQNACLVLSFSNSQEDNAERKTSSSLKSKGRVEAAREPHFCECKYCQISEYVRRLCCLQKWGRLRYNDFNRRIKNGIKKCFCFLTLPLNSRNNESFLHWSAVHLQFLWQWHLDNIPARD